MRVITQNLSPNSTLVEKVSFASRQCSMLFEGFRQNKIVNVLYPPICNDIRICQLQEKCVYLPSKKANPIMFSSGSHSENLGKRLLV